MADREFKIKITTTADTAGAKETKEDLNALSPETEKYINKLKEQEGWADRNELQGRRLTQALRMISPELGEIGHAAHILEAGPLAALVLSLAVLGKTLDSIHEQHKKFVDAWKERIDLTSIREAAEVLGEEGLIKALNDSQVAWDVFMAKLRSAAGEQEGFKQATDDATEAIKRQAEEGKKETDAEEKKEIARVKMRKEAGLLSAEEAAAQEAAIHDKYDKKRFDAETQRDRDILNKKKEERDKLPGAIDAATDEASGASRAAGRAEGDLAKAKSEAEGWKKAWEENEKWAKEHLGDNPAADESYRQRRHQISEKLAELEENKIPAAETAAKVAEEEKAASEKRLQDLENRKKELDRGLPKDQANFDSSFHNRVGEYVAARQAREYETTGTLAGSKMGQTVDLAGAAERAHELGRQGSAEQEAAFKLLQTSLGAQTAVILHGLTTTASTSDVHTKQIADLVRKIEEINRRAYSAHTP